MSKVKLSSSDSKSFTVDREVAQRSMLIKNMLEDVGDDGGEIPLPNVKSTVLEKVIAYCEHHKNDAFPGPNDDEDDTRRKGDEDAWDQDFIKVDSDLLFEIILAANYLDIKSLLDLGCKTVAGMIKGKSPQQIRDLFGIENDFTPEEEEQIRRENEWARHD